MSSLVGVPLRGWSAPDCGEPVLLAWASETFDSFAAFAWQI